MGQAIGKQKLPQDKKKKKEKPPKQPKLKKKDKARLKQQQKAIEAEAKLEQERRQQAQDEIVEKDCPFAMLDEVLNEEKPLQALAHATHFDIKTLRKLKGIFAEISDSRVQDSMIDFIELSEAMGLDESSLLGRSIFRVFDSTRTKTINFRTFVTTLSALSDKASLDEKIRFSFALYDLNGDGRIDIKEIRSLLVEALRDGNLSLTEEQIQQICDHTFATADVDGNGTLDFEEYNAMVSQSSRFMRCFSLDVDELCRQFHKHASRRRSTLSNGGSGRLSQHASASRNNSDSQLDASGVSSRSRQESLIMMSATEIERKAEAFRSRQRIPSDEGNAVAAMARQALGQGSSKPANSPFGKASSRPTSALPSASPVPSSAFSSSGAGKPPLSAPPAQVDHHWRDVDVRSASNSLVFFDNDDEVRVVDEVDQLELS